MTFADHLEIWLHSTFFKIRYGDHTNFVNLLHDRLVSNWPLDMDVSHILKKMFVVVNVPYLTRYGDAFFVECANFTIVNQGFEGGFAELCIDEITADHDTCSALSGLAVDGYHVFTGLVQEAINVPTEVVDIDERGWLMIVELKLLRDFIEVTIVVCSLRAQVIDFVPSQMLCVEENLHIIHVVPVHSLEALRRKPHGDDPICYVTKVQVVPFFLVAVLLE